MASRSSRSSLLGPPITVAEDDDSIMNGIQSENRPNRTPARSSREEIDTMLSPAVERAIRGFNEELDELTRSMEKISKLSRSSTKMASSTRTPRAPQGYMMATSTTSSYREKDPPPSVQPSPLRSYIEGTPVKRSGPASHTPSEPPPAPVETPGFGSPTPNRHRTRRTTAPPPPPPTQVDETFMFSQHEPTPTRQRDSRDTKMEELCKIVREQVTRIRELEVENEILRKKLHLRPPTVERVHRASSVMDDFFPEHKKDAAPPPSHAAYHQPHFEGAGGATVPTRRDRSERSTTFPEEPQGIHQSFDDSPYRPQSSFFSTPSRRGIVDHPPRQIHTLGDAIQQTNFTPGTRFVAELATLVNLEQTHIVPLSYMIDKHWDRLKLHFQQDDGRD